MTMQCITAPQRPMVNIACAHCTQFKTVDISIKSMSFQFSHCFSASQQDMHVHSVSQCATSLLLALFYTGSLQRELHVLLAFAQAANQWINKDDPCPIQVSSQLNPSLVSVLRKVCPGSATIADNCSHQFLLRILEDCPPTLEISLLMKIGLSFFDHAAVDSVTCFMYSAKEFSLPYLPE